MIRRFLAHVARGHEQKRGRFGNPKLTTPPKPATVKAYFRVVQAMFRWAVEDGILTECPMGNLKPPIVRQDQIQPFTDEQVMSLRDAAKRSTHPRRDEAIVLLMLDTGIRVSELAALTWGDVDLSAHYAIVQGKGRKTRMVPIGREVTKALWAYSREHPLDVTRPLFPSDRGWTAGGPLTRSGLLQLIRRLGKAARIDSARCSPHTFRHTMAISFLRSGGQEFTLMQILGHTSLTMTRRYVALANADVAAQHRMHSPADRLKRK
jgi:integrase/recombinase XerC